MSNPDTIDVKIIDDIMITVPASTKYMTTFVLQEQNDWFEDEIKFIREFITSGMKVIDIGANYGLYTLPIANKIGDSGYLWAFEPTSSTLSCLKNSIKNNNFSNIKLIQTGLSDRIGEADFYLSNNSELNSLSKGISNNNSIETISLTTLDHCKQKYNWENIDFIKLDAEGEEDNILKKGEKTLSALSPLIMYELKHGDNINLPLINRFKDMGYNSYRLIPSLNTLIPFDHTEPFDDYQLNLFCCKQDKSILLESDNYLVNSWPIINEPSEGAAKNHITALPFSQNSYISKSTDTSSKEYFMVLNNYIASLSPTESISKRVGYLMTAKNDMQIMIEREPQSVERLTTFSRIAFDAGERKLGVTILTNLINNLANNMSFSIKEIFLPASPRYDDLSTKNNIHAWLISSILERYIEKHAFSAYFTKNKTLGLFEELITLGFISSQMYDRYQLIKKCYS